MEFVPLVGVVAVVLVAAVGVRRATLGRQMDRSLEGLKSRPAPVGARRAVVPRVLATPAPRGLQGEVMVAHWTPIRGSEHAPDEVPRAS